MAPDPGRTLPFDVSVLKTEVYSNFDIKLRFCIRVCPTTKTNCLMLPMEILAVRFKLYEENSDGVLGKNTK